MNGNRICSRCGAALTVYAPEGLCPRCMLRGVLAPAGDEGIPDESKDGFTTGESPGSSELDRSQDAPGFGDYRIIEELGRGGMGVVYKARQRSLNRMVALKMIQSQRLASPPLVQRFQMEAEAAASLRHPNIVAIHEVGEHAGQHFFTMDFIEGRSLSEAIQELKSSGRDFRQTAQWLKTIAQAIHYAHQRGILHRDLKPSNILLDANREPHVTDFGLARRLEYDSTLTASGEVLGSPAYMAPEQAAGSHRQVTIAADVYSLGGILYELLTGRPPFTGATPAETLHQVLHAEVVEPRLMNASVPRDLETICLKCLEKEPARRYGSAGQIAEELERFLRDEPIQARRTRAVEKLWRWARRNRVVAGLSGVAILASAAGVAGIAWQWRQAVSARRTAETATRDKQEQLWNSQLIEARFYRSTSQRGQRSKPLEVIADAANWRPSVELRSEAIAALVLPDLGTNAWFRSQERARYHFTCDAGFEHYMPDSRSGRVEIRRTRDHSIVNALGGLGGSTRWSEFSPDGRHLAVSFSGDGTNCRVGLWDWRATRRVLSFATGLSPASNPTFDFTPDGRELVVATRSGPVRRFDVETGSELQPPLLSVEARALCLSPSGRTVAIHRRGELQVWSLTTSQQVARCALPKGLEDIAWHPHEELLGIATPAGLFLWNFGAKEPGLISVSDNFTRVLFSPDGDLLIGGAWDNFCGVWDAASGRLLLSNRDGAPVQLSRDGGTLAYVHEYLGVGARVFVRPRGLRRFLVPQSVGGDYETLDARFHPNGRWLVSAHRHGWLLWDSITGRIVARNRGARVSSARFVPDGLSFLTCGDGGVQRWRMSDVDSSHPQVAEPEPLPSLIPNEFARLALSADGKRFAAVSIRTATIVGRLDDSGVMKLAGSEKRGGVFIQFSPDGRWVMTSDYHGTRLYVYDAESGRHVRDLSSGGCIGFFQPDGQGVLGVGPRDFTFWKTGTWELVRRVPAGESGLNTISSGFSPDGRFYLISDREAHLRFRDAATDRDFVTFIFPGTGASNSSFDPDGQRLVVASSLNELFLWDLGELRRELARLGLDWRDEQPGIGFAVRQAR